MNVCGLMCTREHMWRSGDNSLSFCSSNMEVLRIELGLRLSACTLPDELSLGPRNNRFEKGIYEIGSLVT